jgi:hypothetical protein
MTTRTQHAARMVGPWVWASIAADSVAMVLEANSLSKNERKINKWQLPETQIWTMEQG